MPLDNYNYNTAGSAYDSTMEMDGGDGSDGKGAGSTADAAEHSIIPIQKLSVSFRCRCGEIVTGVKGG